MQMDFSTFIKKEGRALPVFLLVDTSGSMQGEKIETVNVALKEMISVFRKIENPKGVINLCIITFGNENIQIVKPLSEITDTDYYEFSAEGNTPMGAVFEKVASMIEDHTIVDSRAYIPTIVLISDGNPTDFNGYNESMMPEEIKAWSSLRILHGGARSSKAVKLAMGIGHDVDMKILGAFINNNSIPVIKAQDNGTISKFFEWVTMSIRVRSVSVNPDVFTVDGLDAFDKNEIEFGT
jgi:uncharacterized protein YegL